MKFIETRSNANETVKLHYEDIGQGKPVVLIHGWPLSHEMWEYQMLALMENNYRVIAYDRRGFGKSDRPKSGYDYDTLADDLKAILDGLDLKDVTLIGFSMGGGEVIRYMSRHAGARVSKVVLISTVVPYMLKTEEHPDGIPEEMFQGFDASIRKDRADFISTFSKMFYGVSLISHPVSQAQLDRDFTLAMHGSLQATLACMHSFAETDFRGDMSAVKVPCLIIHGDEDKTVPINISSDVTERLIPGSEYKVYKGAPHGLFITEKDKLNSDLLKFLAS